MAHSREGQVWVGTSPSNAHRILLVVSSKPKEVGVTHRFVTLGERESRLTEEVDEFPDEPWESCGDEWSRLR